MKLTDILSKEEWIEFENDLYGRFDINCTVYDTSGIGITGNPHWCNRLCPKVKGNKEALAAICAVGNNYFADQAKTTRQPVIGECDAGLMKIAVPIFLGDDFLGTAGGCGLLPVNGEVETFFIEKLLKLNEEEIADLCRDIGFMTGSRAEEMVDFIETRIQEFTGVMGNRIAGGVHAERDMGVLK